MPRPKILLLGDSLTQTGWEGWVSKLADIYQRRVDIVNRGYSGYNTEFFLHLPDEDDIYQETASCGGNVCLTVVWFGANDAAMKGKSDHHHLPLDKFETNLKSICEKVTAKNGCRSILLVTPPPVHHQQRLDYQIRRYGDKATGDLERTLEHTGKYADSCKKVAQELGYPCLDMYTLMQEAPVSDYGKFFHDGLHFSSDGHEFVASALLDAVGTSFPDLGVQACPHTKQWCNSGSQCKGLDGQGPYHDEINHEDIKKAFN